MRTLLSLLSLSMLSIGSCVQEMLLRYGDPAIWYGRVPLA